MKTATIQPNQCVLDMALAACGTLEGAMAIMAASNKSISFNPATGTVYTIPPGTPTDLAALQALQQNEVLIGTKD